MQHEEGQAPVGACEAAYDAHAADYARVLDPTLEGIVEELVTRAGARVGDRALDIATGTGSVARALARRGAAVVGADRSQPMLALAREISPEIEFVLADAHELPFEQDEFDVVICALALSHFERPRAALVEALRVLRPGGRFAASTWGRGGGAPSSSTVVELLRARGAADTGYELDEVTWFEPARGIELLREAGFAGARSLHTAFAGRFADAEEALEWTLAWPCGAARLARLDGPAVEAFRADARGALASADLRWELAFNVYLAEKPRVPGG